MIFWPGKTLTPEEEAAIRGLPTNMRPSFERYLSPSGWTPDQLEAGAHIGPWTSIEARVKP